MTGDKPLVWLKGEVKTPPLSTAARIEVGMLLRRLQRGEALSMPTARSMPTIGPRCHELRITDGRREWRLIYHRFGRHRDRRLLLEDDRQDADQNHRRLPETIQPLRPRRR